MTPWSCFLQLSGDLPGDFVSLLSSVSHIQYLVLFFCLASHCRQLFCLVLLPRDYSVIFSVHFLLFFFWIVVRLYSFVLLFLLGITVQYLLWHSWCAFFQAWSHTVLFCPVLLAWYYSVVFIMQLFIFLGICSVYYLVCSSWCVSSGLASNCTITSCSYFLVSQCTIYYANIGAFLLAWRRTVGNCFVLFFFLGITV